MCYQHNKAATKATPTQWTTDRNGGLLLKIYTNMAIMSINGYILSNNTTSLCECLQGNCRHSFLLRQGATGENMQQGAQLNNFIMLHFPTTANNNGALHLWAKSRNKNGKMYRVFYGSPAELMKKATADDLQNRKQDYYITANTMTAGARGREFLFSFNNIVLDIDNHEKNADMRKLEHQGGALCQIFSDMLTEPGAPYVPNTIIYTGRGFQLWYNVEQIGYKCADAWETLNNEIIRQVQDIVENNDVLHGLSVDTGASRNAAGLYRFPVSYNTKSQTRARFYILHDESIDILTDVKKIRAKNKAAAKERITRFYTGSVYDIAERRHNSLLKLAQIRKGQTVERDNIIFCAFCVWAQVCNDDAAILTRLKEINATFAQPFTETEIKQYLKTAFRKRYKLKNKTIIERLNITEEEQDIIRLHATKTNREFERAQARELKTNKHAEIIRLYKAGELTQAEIAERVNVSLRTVNSVLKRAGARKKDVKQERMQLLKREQIRAFKRQIESHIRAKGGMCKNSTIYGGSTRREKSARGVSLRRLISFVPSVTDRAPRFLNCSVYKSALLT